MGADAAAAAPMPMLLLSMTPACPLCIFLSLCLSVGLRVWVFPIVRTPPWIPSKQNNPPWQYLLAPHSVAFPLVARRRTRPPTPLAVGRPPTRTRSHLQVSHTPPNVFITTKHLCSLIIQMQKRATTTPTVAMTCLAIASQCVKFINCFALKLHNSALCSASRTRVGLRFVASL